jgi:ABC-type transport system involved in cytochrome c biogenesis permease subunit
LLVALLFLPSAARAGHTETYGDTPGYRALGEIAVLDSGRIKPLDTSARLHLKEIYGRETLRLESPDGRVERWSALAALVDWPLRPTHWDEQELLLIDMFDYRGFKQLLLASSIKESLRKAAGRDGLPAEARAELETLTGREVITERDLKDLLARKFITNEEDLKALKSWAHKLGDGRKWIAPADLEAAVVEDTDHGHTHAFMDWFAELSQRNDAARRSRAEPKFTPRERRVIDLGERLIRYQAFRDRNERGIAELDIALIPRPANDAYLAYTGQVVERLMSGEHGGADPTGLDADVFNTLGAYLEDVKSINRFVADIRAGKQKLPGQDPDFDPGYRKWVRETSRWLPLRLLKNVEPAELEKAGLDRSLVEQFRAAHKRLEEAAAASPGRLEEAPARALLDAARALGSSTNPAKYPSADAMARETQFNRLAPFAKAPWAYGAALVLLLLSLGIDARPGSWVDRVGRGLYGLGWVAFLAGVAFEIVGFTFRVAISGWAPVTNMYETVIWVALGAALLGLVLEAISRRKYAITAASGVALLATMLAANVPLLDPNIGQLQPVLRDNYWLTVHVLTIVSSYAAFALAMGLGLLGLGYYLSATYRRDVPLHRAARPMALGLPVLAIGLAATFASGGGVGRWPSLDQGWLGYVLSGVGILLASGGLWAVLGEVANRKPLAAIAAGLLIAVTGLGVAYLSHDRVPPTWWPAEELPIWFPATFAGISGLGLAIIGLIGAGSRRVLEEASAARSDESAFAEIDAARAAAGQSGKPKARPSVSEILARAARPKALDARGEAIQHTVAKVKPLSNFLYRAMQVGVLLVAAGTILGGVWADVSWGRFWGWDPKEVWALITLLVYLVPLHGRFAGWVSTFGLVAASVFCFGSVLMAWYGVNFVLGVGLHSYGFTEGGGQGVVIFSTLMVMSLVLAAGWRRHLGSPRPAPSHAAPAAAPRKPEPVAVGR